MSDMYHQPGSTGQTMINGSLNAIIKDKGAVHPDAPGAKKVVLVLRYGFYVPDPPQGEDAVKFIPDRVMSVPYYRAIDMIRDREARFIEEEDSAPLLAKQQEEESARAKEARDQAAMVIASRRAEMGDIADVVDTETSKKIESLEETNKQLSEQMTQMMAMQTAFFKQFGMKAPGATDEGTTVSED